MSSEREQPRRVVILTYPGMQPLDMVGPAEVFTGAARMREESYTVEVVGAEAGAVFPRNGGYGIVAPKTIARCRGPIDTLVVPGGFGVGAAEENQALIRWLRSAARRSRRVTSVCTGAFLLARAGLLDGRRATTHWASCEELQRRYPAIDVDPAPIFVRDGDVWTSAGVTAGIDLSLALVEDDLGAEVAREIARWMVVFLQRPGGQSQFSSHLAAAPADRRPLRELQAWMGDNLDADLRVEALAERVSMSPRNFARAFRRETGLTPAAYVEALRVEDARRRLEQGSEPIEIVAGRCGFGTAETMRRAFARRVGVAPAEYRARFRRAPERAA
ncbi:MAG: GlxA family transcriptional regulator [Thermoleophilaceae bacterium]